MSIPTKGRSFNGKSKNRNKKLTKEKRKIKYIKKTSRKEYDVKVVAREGISKYEGQEVKVSAELVCINQKGLENMALLEHVYVEDEYCDHMWVTFSKEDLRKLELCYKSCRILFTGVVQMYIKRKDRQIGIKYGVADTKLLKE